MIRMTIIGAFWILAATVGWAVEGAAEPKSPTEWYGAAVRPTEPLTPQQEAAGFHLPDGFEIRLFAAEPQIAKPMNLAFDGKGRLWVTQSEQYPYPATDDQPGRDQIRVLQDTDGDGRADAVTCFADGLNIPIGIVPYGDGCICFSIPDLWYLRDTNGDGRCDRREKILGPFDTSRDTHGMVNSLRRGADGWIYACHGFNNQSTVTGGDGHTVQMTSGNTFRFRPDGSRIEIYTRGQVNPFGMTFDQWGNAFTADCHSKPISQLIRGGSYPSFGRPHDGLGFVPPMLDHLHGSTAIAGLTYLAPDAMPAALAGNLLSGNVMTSRINRNRLVWQGATARGEQQPDFLTSDDPWFRPVDVRWGPDGHLYVADFYNKIIGHYEVPLDHPGRDRHRGRIWQIRQIQPNDTVGASPPTPTVDVGAVAPRQLMADLMTANPTQFALAVERLTADVTAVSAELLDDTITNPPNAVAAAAALWALQRRQQLDEPLLCDALRSRDPLIQVHALKVVGQSGSASLDGRSEARAITAGLLASEHAQVARAAAESMGLWPRAEDLSPLLQRIGQTPDGDPILRQTARIAVRNLLIDATAEHAAFARLSDQVRSAPSLNADLCEAASIMLGVPTPRGAAFLLDYLQRWPEAPDRLSLLAHAARHAADGDSGRAVKLAQQWAGDDPSQEQQLLRLMLDATVGRSQAMDDALRRWATQYLTIQLRLLTAVKDDDGGPRPLGWAATGTETPAWPVQQQQTSQPWPTGLWSSFPLGESYTGTFRSDAFPAPPQIAFWIAGHDGRPREMAQQQNLVRLVDAHSGAELRRAAAPRHDQAVRIEWSAEEVAGSRVRIELVDGNAGSAYAWIAAGGFTPPWLEPPASSERLQETLAMIVAHDLRGLRSELVRLAQSSVMPQGQRLLIATHLTQLDGAGVLRGLTEVARRQQLLPAVVEQLIEAATQGKTVDGELMRMVSSRLTLGEQRQLAGWWSQTETGAVALLEAIDGGMIAPDVLGDKEVDQRLRATALSDAQASRLEQLRSLVAESDQQTHKRIADLLQKPPAAGDAARGQALFQQHCAVCHQLAGQGQLVGPQLDGVGSRGRGRLLEDILAPDRNVDRAFRTSTILTNDGRVVVGLVGEEVDGQLPLVGTDGKTQQVPADAIESRSENATSLMPGNFGELLPADQLNDLLHYLQTVPPPV